MGLDYVVLAQWGLVPALGTLLTITVVLSYSIFYRKILEKESEIRFKVRSDLAKEVHNFNKITKRAQGELEFFDRISRIVEFNLILTKSKDLFKKWILISAIVLLILGITFIIYTEKRDFIFVFGILDLTIHIASWLALMFNHDKLEKFLNGDDPQKILGE